MSRYHPVRPQQKNKHPQVPQPAAPAQPRQARQWQVTQEQISEAAISLYKSRGGDLIDASINRWKSTLECYDRELAVLQGKPAGENHRWTISPTIAFRIDKMLHEYIDRQGKLKDECFAEAEAMIRQVLGEAARLQAAGDESLCQPKRPSDVAANTSADIPAERRQAEPVPIAA